MEGGEKNPLGHITLRSVNSLVTIVITPVTSVITVVTIVISLVTTVITLVTIVITQVTMAIMLVIGVIPLVTSVITLVTSVITITIIVLDQTTCPIMLAWLAAPAAHLSLWDAPSASWRQQPSTFSRWVNGNAPAGVPESHQHRTPEGARAHHIHIMSLLVLCSGSGSVFPVDVSICSL